MNFNSIKTKYKYSVMMPPTSGTISHIKTRLLENYKKVIACKFEFLVSSIYEDTRNYYWQPFFDFDTRNASEVKLFIRNEINKQYYNNFFVEITKNGFHVVSTLLYGPLTTTARLDELKKRFKNAFSAYQNYDWLVTCRQTPNRRCFCRLNDKKIVSIVSVEKFISMKDEDIRAYSSVFLEKLKSNIVLYEKIVDNIIFPNELIDNISSVFRSVY